MCWAKVNLNLFLVQLKNLKTIDYIYYLCIIILKSALARKSDIILNRNVTVTKIKWQLLINNAMS